MEMCMSSKSFFTMTANRLIVIAHEDIGLADPDAVVFAVVSLDSVRGRWDIKKPGRYALAMGNVIRRLCRAKKSREGDWFTILTVGMVREGVTPLVEDWMKDMHTQAGKKLGRGLDHFLVEGCKLVPAPEYPEAYEERAIEMLRRGTKEKANPGALNLFEDSE
jgi:hypothetical protein